MKKLMSLFAIVLPCLAYAESRKADVDVGVGSEPMSVREICNRLEVSVDELVFNADGTRLLDKVTEGRRARGSHAENTDKKDSQYACRFKTQWSSRTSAFKEPLAISMDYRVKKDGSMFVSLEQFAKILEGANGSGPQFSDSVKKEEFVVKDLTPIVWRSPLHKDKRVVVRLVPSLSDDKAAEDVAVLPISGDNMTIFDEEGHLWQARVSARGKYVGVETEHGLFFLSYYPFRGAKRLGTAQRQTMELRLGSHTVTLLSASSFLPEGMTANVYGLYDPNQKSHSVNQSHLYSTDKEENVLEKFGAKP